MAKEKKTKGHARIAARSAGESVREGAERSPEQREAHPEVELTHEAAHPEGGVATAEGSARKIADVEKELSAMADRICLAITDARVAMDKAGQSLAEVNAVRSLVEGLSGAEADGEERLAGLAQSVERTEGKLGELALGLDGLAESGEHAKARLGDLSLGLDGLAQSGERTEGRLGELASGLDSLGESVQSIHRWLEGQDGRLDGLSQSMESADGRLEELAIRLDEVETRICPAGESIAKLAARLSGASPGEPTGGPAPAEAEAFAEELADGGGVGFSLDDIFEVMIRHEAADMHLKAGIPPLARKLGELIPVGNQVLTEKTCRHLVLPFMTGEQRRLLREGREVSFTRCHGNVPFRVDAFLQRGSVSGAIRMAQTRIPTPEELGLPREVSRLAAIPSGLVVLAGQARSGRSTAAAALLNLVNGTRRAHIVVIDASGRFAFEDDMSIVTQRVVGLDTSTALDALRHARRQSPDVILMGELSDGDLAMEAAAAAEEGALVIATASAAHGIGAIERLIDSFEGERRRLFRRMLAGALRAVVSLRLLDRADGSGRVPAVEVLAADEALPLLILKERVREIHPRMVARAHEGMLTFALSLRRLLEAGLITKEEALRHNRSIREATKDIESALHDALAPEEAPDEAAAAHADAPETPHRVKAREEEDAPDLTDPRSIMMATLHAAMPEKIPAPPGMPGSAQGLRPPSRTKLNWS